MSSTPPAPQVDITMPDGQTHRGRLYERRQVPDGWLFKIGIVLWRAVDPDHPEPGEYLAWMPADHAAPVPGADYSTVPTTHLDQDVPVPTPSAVQPRPATRWRIVAERRRADAAIPPRTVVHRADCWQARDGLYEEVTSRDAARAAMAQPGARGCTHCGTDMHLNDSPG